MIQYVTPKTRHEILDMWRVCFGDSQPYFDIYFRERYKDENTLAYFEDGKVVASLQLLHYNFSYCNTEIPIGYVSGACTLPEARKKGYMAALLEAAFYELNKKNIPLSLLVPEEEWLLRFYNKFDYAQTFDAGQDLPSLKALMKRHSDDLLSAYKEFDSLFRDKEMVVQKTFDDFRVVVEETAGYDYPTKKSLTGMTRIIDAKKMLQLFAQKYPDKAFSIKVSDAMLAHNNFLIAVDSGNTHITDTRYPTHLNMDIAELAQALLGYHTSNKKEVIKNIFPEHQPQIHFMME